MVLSENCDVNMNSAVFRCRNLAPWVHKIQQWYHQMRVNSSVIPCRTLLEFSRTDTKTTIKASYLHVAISFLLNVKAAG
jgi:hypothetical protein